MRLILLFLFLSTLLNVNIVAATQVAPPVNIALSLPNTQNNHDLVYQQLFNMHSQLASLDEKIQQQKTLGNDVKTLEAAQQALTIQLSRFQSQLDAQKNLQANKFTGFDGRIGDLKDSINWWFSILTIFLALGGLLIYKLSRKEAENVAHQQMEGFISSNADKILANTQVFLEKQLSEANTSVEDLKKYIDEAHEIIEEKKKEVEAAADDVQKSIAEKQEPNPESLRILENSTNKISKEHTTAREYLNLANVSYGKKNYKEALKYLNLAINVLSSEKHTHLHAELLCRALFNQGIIYGQQEKPDDELNSYSALIEQFKDSSNEEIQIEVAMAMLNQGITYGQQGRLEEKFNSYTRLIEQFKDSSNEEIQIRVAKAMFNQGITYGQQSKPEDELNSYTHLIEQFKHSSNEEIQVLVAKAMLNQGVTYGQQEKFEDALNSYTRLIEQFKDSLNEEIQIRVAKAMCNQSATYGLKKDFFTALKSNSMLLETFHSSENGEIKKLIADSKANIAELALLYEAPEQVLNRVAEAEKHSENPQNLAVMQFIRFLLEDKTIEEVFAALTVIPTEMKLTCGFREIKHYLANFEGEKLYQIEAVVSFFEQHKDIEKLRIELGLKS